MIETAPLLLSNALDEHSGAPFQAGDVIDGKYLVGDCIASGGMGIVTEATHLHLQKSVALKCVRPEFLEDEAMVGRFLTEARIAANLKNEHVARVLDFGKTEAGVPYLVMERLEGMSLAALVNERGQLPVPEAIDYVLQACEALAEAHGQGIVHRDIKPENLFLTQGIDGVPILKVLDFGISKQLTTDIDLTLTNPGSSMGSPCYMSPEQMRGAGLVDRRTDVWAMGTVLFELLAAKPPFDGNSLPEIYAHVMCDSPLSLKDLRSGLPRGLEAVVNHCLEKDRDNRYADVAELARALAKYASPVGRASLPSIEHIAANPEPPHSAVRPRSARDSSASFAPTVLQQRMASSDQLLAPGNDGIDAPIPRTPATHARWPWVLATSAALLAAGAGAATYLGHDVFLGHDVLRPLRGVVLVGSLRADAPDALPLTRVLEPELVATRGLAMAEPEVDAASVSGSESGPSISPLRWTRRGSTPRQTPEAPPLPVAPPTDNPYPPAP
jgi:eukaryotic-like serine/threonine-protein kinase